ncbi:hypothetical protein B9Z19DRAFT_1083365 [Tuber borchii]|uniref:Uncharacterized protein n=1 Tax=Tuber borchii TaxID=42251 RepID=A0A2T6ZT69_TUBBO|nr:hypothetical protein B9Z19DRAFT_1083365 [Tuber borchii]
MSGIYYVYMKYTRETDIHRADNGRHLLTFQSRWDADELFRSLQALKTSTGASRLSTLKRVSPQFWCYDAIDGEPWSNIINVQRENVLPEFNYKFMSVILAKAASDHCSWPVFANPTIGPDWVSGKTFYIRNRRQPSLYWYSADYLIFISTDRRTKFCIKDKSYDGERVLIRKDEVTIQPVGSFGTPIGKYVIKSGDGEVLTVGSTRQIWDFSDLFDSVGVTWADETEFSPETQFATSLPKLEDEWELC